MTPKKTRSRLTLAQRRAIDLLLEATPDDEGWTGLMMTQPVSKVEDGTAWIYFRTALAMEKKGAAELDYQFGRIRLLER